MKKLLLILILFSFVGCADYIYTEDKVTISKISKSNRDKYKYYYFVDCEDLPYNAGFYFYSNKKYEIGENILK